MNLESNSHINASKSPRAKKRAAKWRLSGMIKTASGCIDCGYAEHAQALQFDHISDNKKASVSTILEEINKCEIRCANCHAVMTAYRKTQYGNYSSVSLSDQS
jgi:aerobic-type carbon monoxide dehydrogenase small subunit (CoxS/CutS family)